jgi:hypothetical protein
VIKVTAPDDDDGDFEGKDRLKDRERRLMFEMEGEASKKEVGNYPTNGI